MAKADVKAALKALEEFGEANGQRITEPRLHVLGIIAASKTPLTAYEILEALKTKMDKPKPPTAYRALEFLSAHGFVHRIESLNAYVACAENHRHNGSQFLICKNCTAVEEIHLCHIPPKLKDEAAARDFDVQRWNVELYGFCKKCKKTT